MILTSKRTIVITSLVALSAGFLSLLLVGGVFADHEAGIEQCRNQPGSFSECQQRELTEAREECENTPTSLGSVRTACFEHLNPGSTSTTPDGDGNTSVTAGSSDLECGDGGVRLGVGVGDGDDNCVGEGDQNPIFEYLGGIVSFLSIGVGVVVTAMIMVGGIQYSAAGGNPQAVEAAKSRITNAIIALVLYAFMVGILNFLVPGGVF